MNRQIIFSSLLFLSFAFSSGLTDDAKDISPVRIAEAKATLSKSLNANVGKDLTEHLIARGMSKQDAERIATEAIDTYAICIIDVLVDQAEKQGQPVEAILASVASFALSPELQEISDNWDKEATRQALLPCAASVAAGAGIEFRE